MSVQLGSLEENILLLVAVMGAEEAYGYSVAENYRHHLGSSISISAVHTVLKRLEKKGYLKSEMSVPTTKRGGRRKRIFQLTSRGFETLKIVQESRTRLWNLIAKT
jgi:PadR family transcriptional regulator PadR